jgi:hypothetical protein
VTYPLNVHAKCTIRYTVAALIAFLLGIGIGKSDVVIVALPPPPAAPLLFEAPEADVEPFLSNDAPRVTPGNSRG